MRKGSSVYYATSGALAGIINGLLGGGGGMILVPMLTASTLEDSSVFPSSVAVILPICIISLLFAVKVPWITALPYLIGSTAGGIAAGIWGKKIPVLWLHKGLGLLILWGGIRYLWPCS